MYLDHSLHGQLYLFSVEKSSCNLLEYKLRAYSSGNIYRNANKQLKAFSFADSISRAEKGSGNLIESILTKARRFLQVTIVHAFIEM